MHKAWRHPNTGKKINLGIHRVLEPLNYQTAEYNLRYSYFQSRCAVMSLAQVEKLDDNTAMFSMLQSSFSHKDTNKKSVIAFLLSATYSPLHRPCILIVVDIFHIVDECIKTRIQSKHFSETVVHMLPGVLMNTA